MVDFDSAAFAAAAAVRELLPDELAQLEEWICQFKNVPLYSGEKTLQHPLVAFHMLLIENMRHTPFFTHNFKLVNKTSLYRIICDLHKH